MPLIPAVPGLADRRMYVFLLLLTLGSGMSFQGWNTLYTNFAVHGAGLSGAENGLVQSIREVPGLLTFGVIPLLLLLREHRLAALAVLVTGVGVMTAGLLPTLWGVVATTLVMSFGFHYFEAVNQSLILQYFDVRTAPLVMGRLRGLAAGGNLVMGALVYVLADLFAFSTLFCIMGSFATVAGAWALTRDPSDPARPAQRRSMVLRRRYWLFYLLTILAGARRQIFTVFSVLLLVEHFGYGVREVALLFIVNNAVNWFLNPLIGRAVNRFGEQHLLTVEYSVLVLVFLGYTVTDSPLVAAFLYVVDHIFFNFAIAIRTFFQKIADPADIAPSMAMSVAINHIAAVVMPVCGGMLWMLDYRIPFYVGAGLAVASLLATQRIGAELRLQGVKPC